MEGTVQYEYTLAILSMQRRENKMSNVHCTFFHIGQSVFQVAYLLEKKSALMNM
jgi:hypothetical protein